jgi:hypothetical protein
MKAGGAAPRPPSREVVLLDFPWEWELPLAGDGQRDPSLRLPKRERRELAPALSPRMPG